MHIKIPSKLNATNSRFYIFGKLLKMPCKDIIWWSMQIIPYLITILF